MVLDIKLFRSPNTLEIIRKSHSNRYGSSDDIDDIIMHDTEHLQLLSITNNRAKCENIIGRILGKKFKEFKTNNKGTEYIIDRDVLIQEDILNSIPNINQTLLEQMTIDELVKVSEICSNERVKLLDIMQNHVDMKHILLRKIGNILHETVPIGPDDDSNTLLCTISFEHTIDDSTNDGTNADTNDTNNEYISSKLLSHYDLIKMISGVDTKAGSKIAGNRGYYLKGPCVYLSQALQQFALHLLDEQDFVAIQTPYFMNEDVMANVAQISQFDEELYKVVCNNNDSENATIKYLIATSEQPLTALHMDEKINVKNLPIKYAGISTCFRKETGRHGKDTLGIFRVHQFEKVEQFIICSSENNVSWTQLEHMLKNSTTMLDMLKIPYRVVNIASGELNLAAAKKYDIEGWFPGSKTYRELVSCSNCTDYHSRNLNIKHTSKIDKDGKFVHMLNSTMCAVTRMICVILENYQTDKGIIVPSVLQQYMPKKYRELIPFV